MFNSLAQLTSNQLVRVQLPSPVLTMITANILSYNSGATIHRAVASLHRWVDKIIIAIDEKTSDGSDKLIRSMPYVESYRYKFTDFASARNLLMKHSPRGFDEWIFMLDSDEVIESQHAARLRPLTKGIFNEFDFVEAFRFTRRHWHDLAKQREHKDYPPEFSYPDTTVRLWRNNGDVRFEGLLHEELRGCSRVKVLFDMEVQHFGQFPLTDTVKKAIYTELTNGRRV